jgi:hypothetical protein
MINEIIIQQGHNRYTKAFKEQAIRKWMNSGRYPEMTAKRAMSERILSV